MKILFLDIDGVLNSDRYVGEWNPVTDSSIDETRLPLLRRILEETGAVVVLSTSWRVHWHPDPDRRDPAWRKVGDSLDRYGIEIYDRTPNYAKDGGVTRGDSRDSEIRGWLADHEGEVESFVILDDYGFGWGDLSDRLVKTSPKIGRGLTEDHVTDAIKLLNTPVHL
jgi:hypothetical protein